MSRNLTLAFPAEMTPVLMEVLQLGKASIDLHGWAEQLLGRLLHKHLSDVRKTSSETISLRHGWKHAINYKNARLICISWTMHQDVFFAEGNSELHLDAEGLTHFQYAVLEHWSFNSLAWQGSESRQRFTAGLITVAKSAEGLLDELCRLHSWKCSQISINVLWRSASQSSTLHLSAISGTWKSLTLRKSC